jgi:hypothetical protein
MATKAEPRMTDLQYFFWKWRTSPRHEWRVLREKFLLGLGRRMPRSVRYWATIVSCAEATQGQWGNEHPDTVSIMTMLKRVGG